jgi:hypothetical protein
VVVTAVVVPVHYATQNQVDNFCNPCNGGTINVPNLLPVPK